MAINRLVVVASIEGVKNVVSQISSIGDAAAGTERRASLLSKSLGSLFTAISIAGIARYSDSFINLQNKLKVVTNSTQQLGEVTNKLYDISVNTRTAFSDTAKLYQRVALAGQQLGNSQETNLRLTDLLNKAIISSGASSIEASNAMIQLSQGLAKGTLNGDELRSVLEQLPYVADLIAKHMGVTRGQLRGLGADGKITAQIVQESILAAGDQIDATFSKLGPTIGQAFTVLESSFTLFLGRVNEATGIFTGFANVILGVAKNLDLVAGGLLAVGTIAATIKLTAFSAWMSQMIPVVQQLGMIRGIMYQMLTPMTRLQLGLLIVRTAFIQATQAAIAFTLSNPFTALLAAALVVIPLMYKFADSIFGSKEAGDQFRASIDSILAALSQGLVPILQAVIASLRPIVDAVGGLFLAIQAGLQWLQQYTQGLTFLGEATGSAGTFVYALAEGFAYMIRVVGFLVGGPLALLGEALYAMGAIGDDAIASIRASTLGLSDMVNAATAAQQRITAFSQAQAAAKGTTDAETDSLNNNANASNRAYTAADALGVKLHEKAGYLLETELAYVKVNAGVEQFIYKLGGVSAGNQQAEGTFRSMGVSMAASADGMDAISASAAYYEEKAAKAKENSKGLGTQVSQLATQTLPTANEGMTKFGDTTGKVETALKNAGVGAKELDDNAKGASSTLSGQKDVIAGLIPIINDLAIAYKNAAAAARELAAARSGNGSGATGSSAPIKLHTGGIAGKDGIARYHSGGIADQGIPLSGDEIMAILQKGEEVLTKDDPRHQDNDPWGYKKWFGAGVPDDTFATVTHNSRLNGSDRVQFNEPLSQTLRNLQRTADVTGQDQTLPEVMAGISRTGFNGKAFASVFSSYNAADPFGSAIADYQVGKQMSELLGGVDPTQNNPMYDELIRLQSVFMDSLKGDWVSKQNLQDVLAAQAATPPSQRDYQTLNPFDQGYKGRGPASWTPEMVATQGTDGKVNGDININIELKANDMNSIRQNAATLDQMMYSAVERAKRRVNR